MDIGVLGCILVFWVFYYILYCMRTGQGGIIWVLEMRSVDQAGAMSSPMVRTEKLMFGQRSVVNSCLDNNTDRNSLMEKLSSFQSRGPSLFSLSCQITHG